MEKTKNTSIIRILNKNIYKHESLVYWHANSKALKNTISGLIFLIILTVTLILLSVLASIPYLLKILSQSNIIWISTAATSFVFSISVIIYLAFYKKMSKKAIIKTLGLERKGLTMRNILIGVLVFTIILVLEIIVIIIEAVSGVQINTNVSVLLANAPIWFYVFTIFIGPINEEILFRGFLVGRIGIVLAAFIFGLAHTSYNSTFGIEIIAAFIFGIASGYVFTRTKSLYPSIIAHMLVNLIAALQFIFLIKL